jgi:hypothetical protein
MSLYKQNYPLPPPCTFGQSQELLESTERHNDLTFPFAFGPSCPTHSEKKQAALLARILCRKPQRPIHHSRPTRFSLQEIRVLSSAQHSHHTEVGSAASRIHDQISLSRSSIRRILISLSSLRKHCQGYSRMACLSMDQLGNPAQAALALCG